MAAATSSATLLSANDDKNPHRRCFFSPEREINRKILTEGFFSHLYCAPADSPIRSAKSAAFAKVVFFSCTLFHIAALEVYRSCTSLRKFSLFSKIEMKHENHGYQTCLRQYMKAILFQKKSSERTSSLILVESKNDKFSPKSHQRSHPVSVHPVKANIKQIRPTTRQNAYI